VRYFTDRPGSSPLSAPNVNTCAKASVTAGESTRADLRSCSLRDAAGSIVGELKVLAQSNHL